MLFFGVLSILLAVASAQNCTNQVESICKNSPNVATFSEKCNARHGQIKNLEPDLQGYANYNLVSSFQYLLMSCHFGNYDAHREGFKALYRKLSDQSWEDTISILKYLGKRGGETNFNQRPHNVDVMQNRNLDLDEITSLSKALDMQKGLAEAASRIYSKAMHHGTHDYEDPGIIHYLEEQFIEPQTDRIRDLAGYTNDLKEIVGSRDASIGVFLFDEYLKKSL